MNNTKLVVLINKKLDKARLEALISHMKYLISRHDLEAEIINVAAVAYHEFDPDYEYIPLE